MKVSNTGKNNSEVDFSYHIDGQLASRRSGDKVENFYWDDLALVKKDGTDYINEPYATGGNPVLANDEVMFNDMLGTTLGSVDNGKFSSTPTTAFGAGNDNAFFTGKPHVEGLGYAFMFRNYRPEMGKWQTADPFGYIDGWNNFAYCNNRTTTYVDILGGWGDAVHSNATYRRAISSGFTPAQAQRIANADNGVDSGSTGPMPWQDQSRHFDTDGNPNTDSRQTNADREIANATQDWKNGNQDAALDALGRALHSLQDIDAHQDYGADSGSITTPHPGWYDDPNDPRRVNEFSNTLRRTQQTIKAFRKAVGLPE